MLSSFLRFFSNLNHSRIERRKLKRIAKELSDVQVKCLKTFPDSVRKVLIVDTLYCFGDALFVNGLLKFLSDRGISIGIVTFSRLNNIYSSVIDERSIYNIEDSSHYEHIFNEKWDMVVDLCYMFNDRWNYRKNIVENLMSYTVVCDQSFSKTDCSHIYSEILDISNCKHFGSRMSRIAERIIGDRAPIIFPYARPVLEGKDDNEDCRYIYVNTVGGTRFRCLSPKQIIKIASVLNDKRIHGLFYCDKDVTLEETEYVKRIWPKTFSDCFPIISRAVAVISPDTSIVHVASAYDKPILAFYCANDSEHYGLQMKDVWGPLSSKRKILMPDAKGVHRISVSSIDDKKIALALSEFLSSL